MIVFIRMTINNNSIEAIEAARINHMWDVVTSYTATIRSHTKPTSGTTIANCLRVLSSIIEKNDRLFFFSPYQRDTFVKVAKPYSEIRVKKRSFVIPSNPRLDNFENLTSMIYALSHSEQTVTAFISDTLQKEI